MLEKFKEFEIENSQTVVGSSTSINERPATIPVFAATYVGINPANGREMYRS